jgi:hypothetical protein
MPLLLGGNPITKVRMHLSSIVQRDLDRLAVKIVRVVRLKGEISQAGDGVSNCKAGNLVRLDFFLRWKFALATLRQSDALTCGVFFRFFGDSLTTDLVSDLQGLRHSWLGVAPRLIVGQESPDIVSIHLPHFFGNQTRPVRSFLNLNRARLDLQDLNFLDMFPLAMAADGESKMAGLGHLAEAVGAAGIQLTIDLITGTCLPNFNIELIRCVELRFHALGPVALRDLAKHLGPEGQVVAVRRQIPRERVTAVVSPRLLRLGPARNELASRFEGHCEPDANRQRELVFAVEIFLSERELVLSDAIKIVEFDTGLIGEVPPAKQLRMRDLVLWLHILK